MLTEPAERSEDVLQDTHARQNAVMTKINTNNYTVILKLCRLVAVSCKHRRKYDGLVPNQQPGPATLLSVIVQRYCTEGSHKLDKKYYGFQNHCIRVHYESGGCMRSSYHEEDVVPGRRLLFVLPK